MAPKEPILCPNGHIVDKKKEGVKLHQVFQRHSCSECRVELAASATRYRCRGHCDFDICETCFAKKDGSFHVASGAGLAAWAARPKSDKYEIGDLWLKGAVRRVVGVPQNASCEAAGNAVDEKALPAREERGIDAAGAREASDAGSATGSAAKEGETGPGNNEEANAWLKGGEASATDSSSVRPAEGKPTPKSGEGSAADSGAGRPAEGRDTGPGSGQASAGGEANTADPGAEECATGKINARDSYATQSSSLPELTAAEKERREIMKLVRHPGAVRKCTGKLKASMSRLEAMQGALDLKCQAEVSRDTKGQLYAAHWRCTNLQAELKACVDTLERLHTGCARGALTAPFERAAKAQETCHKLLEECNALEAAE